MRNQKDRPMRWSRLDNAATIFPPTSHGADTGVFRLCCELRQDVDPERLQLALEQTLEDFPHMKSCLRRGVFWYYLEQSGRPLHVVPEQNPPCARLYRGSRSPLLEVSFWRHKINLDIFHVLADGVGAISFFQALITRYLELLTPGAEAARPPDISPEARSEDGFARYYQPGGGQYGSQRRAYRLKGARRRDGALTILEGVADVDQLLRAAHAHNTTLTVYLCAVLIQAVREEMGERDKKRPVVLTIPVDLRSYFKTDTARNFFGIMRVSYDFSQGGGAFEEISESVASQFRKELTAERLGARMNALSGLQRQPLLRVVPLVLKNPILRLSGEISSLGETATISNVGRFRLPEALAPQVRGFGVFMSTHCTQICTCTFGKEFHMGFTSVLRHPGVQRRFFQRLHQDGIELEIRSNAFYADAEGGV